MTLHSLKMVSVGALVRVAKATATLLVTDKKGARNPYRTVSTRQC